MVAWKGLNTCHCNQKLRAAVSILIQIDFNEILPHANSFQPNFPIEIFPAEPKNKLTHFVADEVRKEKRATDNTYFCLPATKMKEGEINQ